MEALRERIEAAFEDTLRSVELLVPYDQGARLSELYEVASDLDREERPDGVLVRARLGAADLHRFEDLDVNGADPARG